MDGSNAAQEAPAQRDFERTGIWIFDLDNTLYPAACNLFAEVDVRMTEFIGKQLGVPMAYARHLQKSYFRQFGTTLSGLMRIHKFDPQPFLDYVHNIDLSVVDEAPDLAAAIEALQGRKLIYTNGSRRHDERVAVIHCGLAGKIRIERSARAGEPHTRRREEHEKEDNSDRVRGNFHAGCDVPVNTRWGRG